MSDSAGPAPLSVLSVSDWLGLVGMTQSDYSQIPSVVRGLADEHGRMHQSVIDLVASHNYLGPTALSLLSSPLAEHSMSGQIGNRAHAGSAWVDRLDAIVVALGRSLFGAATVEYRAMTGAVANGIALAALCEPGDVVYAIPPEFGGHRTHHRDGYPGALGLTVRDIPCDGTGEIDLEGLARAMRRRPAKLLLLGTAYLRFPYPLEELSQIAGSAGAQVLYDGAHVLGLIGGRQFQDPLSQGAAVLTGSTQKTLGGPIGGLVMTNDETLGAKVADKTSGLISNYQNNRVAALAIALAEIGAFGEQYAANTIANARYLAERLASTGIPVVGRGQEFTRSHIVLIDSSALAPATQVIKTLEASGILVSEGPHFRDQTAGRAIRVGTAAVTRRGMGRDEMALIADFVGRALLRGERASSVAADVGELARRYNTVAYCFAA